MDASRQLEHIELIYRAATNPQVWTDFIDDVSSCLGTAGGNLLLKQTRASFPEVVVATHVTEGQLESYVNRGIAEKDYTIQSCYQLPAERSYLLEDGGLTAKEFACSEFYEEWACDTPLFWGIGGFFFRRGGRAGVVGWHREAKEGDLDPYAKIYVDTLMPHLKRAFLIQEVHDGLQTEIAGHRSKHDDPSVGSLVVSRKGTVIYVSKDARGMLHKASLDVVSGRLTSPLPGLENEINGWLAALLGTRERALSTLAPTFLVHRGELRSPLYVSLTRFKSGPVGSYLHDPPSALLQIRDPELLGDFHAMQIRESLGLTLAEAKLAVGLARGERLEDYAIHNGITLTSARTYCKRAMKKLHVHSQAQLVSSTLYALL